jgi:hypothetical protein
MNNDLLNGFNDGYNPSSGIGGEKINNVFPLNKRITPENISKLEKNEVFVFGSNESGIHGAGAAQLAYLNFGAKLGMGFGLSGNAYGECFAIPTKDWYIKTLQLEEIQFYINRFIDFTKLNKNKKFYVTKIGCGLAGYNVDDIAPLFKEAQNLDNVFLPIEFILCYV